MANPWTLDVVDGYAFVADNEAGVVLVSLDSPDAPTVVEVVETAGRPVDIAVTDSRVFVAQGGFGVEIFERTGRELEPLGILDTPGTAQAVDANDEVLAIAAWSQVVTYDADSLVLLATEKLQAFPDFEQDLGVALRDDHVFIAEWNDMHILEHRDGYIAADMWTPEQMLAFEASAEDARAVVVENRGHLPLKVTGAVSSHEAFGVSFTELLLPPGSAEAFEVRYSPGHDVNGAVLTVTSNDIDRPELPLGLVSHDTSRIDVGDKLTSSFSFLDPSGSSQLDGLSGHVVVLAYFALF